MTICIAALYLHAYGPRVPEDVGHAVVLASDRALTNAALSVEYEPGFQQKYANVTDHIILLPADDISVHSELIRQIRAFAKRTPGATVRKIAETYGEYMCLIKSKRAVTFAMGSTYNFSAKEFAELQSGMDREIVAKLHNDMDEYERRIHVRAIVAGCDSDGTAHIYYVDPHGIVHCHDDIGFVCIGSGHSQAASQFVQRGYSNRWIYYQSLFVAYLAKKAAEASPGVGPTTDMFQVTRGGVFKIHERTFVSIEKIYTKYDQRRKKIDTDSIQELMKEDAKNIEEDRKEKEIKDAAEE